jgi:hypothetical protein
MGAATIAHHYELTVKREHATPQFIPFRLSAPFHPYLRQKRRGTFGASFGEHCEIYK